MKNCDENTKLDDSFATYKKMSLCGTGKIFVRKEISNMFFSKISL